MSVVDNDRPPYVAFERRSIEDRTASLAAGHYCTQDIDIAIITRPGSRDTLEKDAKVWLMELKDRHRKGEVPQTWYPAFAESYKNWSEGLEVPATGTPILGWPPLSPSAQREIIHQGIRTVEDLANLPDGANVLMGGIALKQKAIAWLEAAQDKGIIAEKVSAQSVKIDELSKLVQEQAAEIDALRKRLPQPAPKG
jgi:hypothetical protein